MPHQVYIPCGRQAKDVDLLNCMNKYLKLCYPLRKYSYKEAWSLKKDFLTQLSQQFEADSMSIAGKSLGSEAFKKIVRKACRG